MSRKSQRQKSQDKHNDVQNEQNYDNIIKNIKDKIDQNQLIGLDHFKYNINNSQNQDSKVQKIKKSKISITYDHSQTSSQTSNLLQKQEEQSNNDNSMNKYKKQTKVRRVKQEIISESKQDNNNENKNEKKPIEEQKSNNNNENDEEIRGYEEVYNKIKEYRNTHMAPVDTLGCHLQGDKTLEKNDQNFQKLVSIILSVQTKDEITDLVMKKIQKEKLTIDKFIEISDNDLKTIISSVNFNSKKVIYIKNAANYIKQNHNSIVPDSYEDLVKIKGIGPKVANLFLQCAYNKTVGIAVDTHVHRISNRLGWIKTKTPEQSRVQLEKLLKQKHWEEINAILVGYGQILCKPINPQCQICPVQKYCEEGLKNLNQKNKKNKKQKDDSDDDEEDYDENV